MKKKEIEPTPNNIRQILHNEEIAIMDKRITKKVEKLRKEKLKEAEETEIIHSTLSGPKGSYSRDYIDRLRRANVNITTTDIKRSLNPPRSIILDEYDTGMKRCEMHYRGLRDGLLLRVGVIALLGLVYVL